MMSKPSMTKNIQCHIDRTRSLVGALFFVKKPARQAVNGSHAKCLCFGSGNATIGTPTGWMQAGQNLIISGLPLIATGVKDCQQSNAFEGCALRVMRSHVKDALRATMEVLQSGLGLNSRAL
jgi:hypothetical protein